MSRKTKLSRSVAEYNPGRGPEIFPVHVQPPQAIYGVLWYFAVLAYPDRSDSKDREDFAKALHSWRCKNVRADIRHWQQLPAEIRGMKNRSIGGKLHMGLKRGDRQHDERARSRPNADFEQRGHAVIGQWRQRQNSQL